MKKKKRLKIFVFSDESGSWHGKEQGDVYLRSWIIISEEEYKKLQNKVTEIVSVLGCRELKWKALSGQTGSRYISDFHDIDFKIFITLSVPKDINWDQKYKLTKNFDQSMSEFDFGSIDGDLVKTIKKKIYDDIRYILFLNYYEKTHIENAVKRIEDVIATTECDLIFRIDPPQANKRDWGEILKKITNKELEFPKSEKNSGIQFADVVAGAYKSFLLHDEKFEVSKDFFIKNKHKFLSKSKTNPNPNLIFFSEISDDMKKKAYDTWDILDDNMEIKKQI